MTEKRSPRRSAQVRRTFSGAWTTIALGVIGLVAIAHTASAQTTGGDLTDTTLEQLMGLQVVTASTSSELVTDAPGRVQVITALQIRRRGYRSLIDVLKDLSDFKVDIGGDPDYPSELVVQGSRGAGRVIVMLDGIRISSPTNEPLPILANYPIHGAKQVEILYGPASALYGADAFSAVINIISRSPDEEPGAAIETSVGQYGLQSYAGSYARRLGPDATVFVAGQLVSDQQPDLSRFYPDDYQGLRGQRTGTFNTVSGTINAVGTVSPNYDAPMLAHSAQAYLRVRGWRFSLFENQSRVTTTGAYTPDNTIYSDVAFNRNSLVVGSASFTGYIGGVTSTSTVTASRHELDPESSRMNVFTQMRRGFKYSYGSMIKGEQQLTWKPTTTSTLTTGATVERFFSIPQGAATSTPVEWRTTPEKILGTNIVDDLFILQYSNVGAYAEYQQRLARGVTGTVGGRFDRNSRFGVTFNPRLGVVLHPANDATTVKILYGTAYLAPSPYQAYNHYGSFYSLDGGKTYESNFWHVPNPDLKPQRKQTVEVSVLQSMSRTFAVSLSSFYSRVTDKILQSDPDQAYSGFYKIWPVSYIEFPVNEGSETTYGATIGVDFENTMASTLRFNTRASLTLIDGRTEGDYADNFGDILEVGGMAPVQFRLGSEIRRDKWSVAPRLSVSGPQRLRATLPFPNSATRRTLDGYATVDMTVRRQDVYKELDLFATVENMFDARYYNINMGAYLRPAELIGAPQNPRRVIVGARLQIR